MLIVVEGVDCSGKATQTKLLMERLRQAGRAVATYPFPRHGQPFFGVLVDQYLNNEFGDAAKLDPRVAALFFACDRFEAKDQLFNWLKQGKTVILDRYASSNMAHQAGKIKDLNKRDEFLGWLAEMEFKVFKIPQPDLVFYLDVPIDIILELMAKRSQVGKEYINGARDGHENSEQHLIDTRQAYLYLCQKYNYWQRIECMDGNKLLPPEAIHEKIWGSLNAI